jgi:plastocyanin
LAAVAVLPLIAFGGASVEAASTIKINAGGGETGYAVNVFLPNAATVMTGDTIQWTMPWSEPHTVTFGQPPANVDPTALPVPFPTAPVNYDGTGFITSGLIGTGYIPGPPGTPQGPTSFSVKFTKAGAYDFYCAIHPNMTGKITVVDSGTVSKQADLDAAAAATYSSELSAIKAVAAGLNKPATVAKQADGSNLYTVVVAGETQNADAMQYFPPAVNVTAGDSVKFASDVHTPHTVTFGPPPPGDPFEAPATDLPNGYAGGAANSGIIGIDFPGGLSYTMKFVKAGTFNYGCLLHQQEGMVGSVIVAAAPAPPATATPTKAPGAPNTGSGPASNSDSGLWIIAGALAIAIAASGLTFAAARR